nr:MAG TPA: hypothetical protein [Caudoviricetes sp.]
MRGLRLLWWPRRRLDEETAKPAESSKEDSAGNPLN